MVRRRHSKDRGQPLYMISVAAELSGMHPQTLRIYERKQLVSPQRSSGNTRLYSEEDIERLRLIHSLTQEEGINLAGVERIIELENELSLVRDEAERLRALAEEARHEAVREIERAQREQRAEIVMVRRGGLARRHEERG